MRRIFIGGKYLQMETSINGEDEKLIYKNPISKFKSILTNLHVISILFLFSILNATRQMQRQFLAVASKPIMRDLRVKVYNFIF